MTVTKFPDRPRPTDPEVYGVLRAWLEQAISGDLRSVILLGVDKDGNLQRAHQGGMKAEHITLLAALITAEATDTVRRLERDTTLEIPGDPYPEP